MSENASDKLKRVQRTKKKVDERKKAPPAGASRGALGNAPVDDVTSGLKAVLQRSKGSSSGNARS